METKKSDKANQFFRKEIEDSDVVQSVHYTFKDGFRLGFGFFVGFMLGTLIVILIAFVLNMLFKAF